MAYSYTLVDDAGGRFSIGGAEGDRVLVAAWVGNGTYPITVEAEDTSTAETVQRTFDLVVPFGPGDYAMYLDFKSSSYWVGV